MNFSELMSIAGGHAEARIVQTAVALGVFEALESAPQSAEAVAAQLQLDPTAAELLLNALAALTLLEKHAQTFSFIGSGEALSAAKASPHYVGGMILFEEHIMAVAGRTCPRRCAPASRRAARYVPGRRAGNRGLHRRHGLAGESARRCRSRGRSLRLAKRPRAARRRLRPRHLSDRALPHASRACTRRFSIARHFGNHRALRARSAAWPAASI